MFLEAINLAAELLEFHSDVGETHRVKGAAKMRYSSTAASFANSPSLGGGWAAFPLLIRRRWRPEVSACGTARLSFI